ncbi:DUF7373 family lipoprotein [Nocardia ignorata]|uniref:DUF7373 family lipoprotein n=1 Tax=Nocardia ignorata TaxID=145285 RepID=UPI003C7AF5E4
MGTEIDPALRYGIERHAIDEPREVAAVLADATRSVAEKHGVMFGFSVRSRTTPLRENTYASEVLEGEPDQGDTTAVGITVLQLPDQARARAAALELEQADFWLAPDLNVPVFLDNYPAAQGHWRPGVRSMVSVVAHGQYVVHVYAVAPKPELGALRSLTERTLAAQLPLLDALPPLSPREVLRLDRDPDGVLRRVLDPRERMPSQPAFDVDYTTATMTPRAFLQLTEDRQEWKRILDLGGVDRIATVYEGALLLRARDRDAAERVWQARKDLPTTTPLAGPQVPDTFCFNNAEKYSPAGPYVSRETRYLCVLRYDRYVAVVMSNQVPDLYQRAAAQYALLANSAYL